MNKEEMIRQALDDMFKPDERQTEKLSHLLDKMTGNLTTQERVERFKTLLKELRNESKEIQRILMEEGNTSGINVLSITEHLEECIRFGEYIEIPEQDSQKVGEVFDRTTNQVQSQEFRVEETERYIYIWDDSEKIGIRFEKGDRLAQYRLTDIVENSSLLTTDEGMRRLDEIKRRLLSFAREKYPREFETEVH